VDIEPESVRLIRFSQLASDDLVTNYEHTVLHWGQTQAERYLDFINESVRFLAAHPNAGHPVDFIRGTRAFFVKWKKAKHGHHIVYRATGSDLYVLRVLHSSLGILAEDVEFTDDDEPPNSSRDR